MTSKSAKYFVKHKLEGKTKKQALIEAGVAPTNQSNIEATQTYQRLDMAYKDLIDDHIGMDEVAREHAKIIRQDADLSTKMRAIESYVKTKDRDQSWDDEDSKLVVVLR